MDETIIKSCPFFNNKEIKMKKIAIVNQNIYHILPEVREHSNLFVGQKEIEEVCPLILSKGEILKWDSVENSWYSEETDLHFSNIDNYLTIIEPDATLRTS